MQNNNRKIVLNISSKELGFRKRLTTALKLLVGKPILLVGNVDSRIINNEQSTPKETR